MTARPLSLEGVGTHKRLAEVESHLMTDREAGYDLERRGRWVQSGNLGPVDAHGLGLSEGVATCNKEEVEEWREVRSGTVVVGLGWIGLSGFGSPGRSERGMWLACLAPLIL